ncbi:unnamed protein product, partial [Symbiodinium necroappetens]
MAKSGPESIPRSNTFGDFAILEPSHPSPSHSKGLLTSRGPVLAGKATVIIMGGNSNWRGPVWFPINYLLIESLQKPRFHQYYGDEYLVECPTGSGNKAEVLLPRRQKTTSCCSFQMSILKIADELSERLIKIFLKAEDGHRPGMRLHAKMKEEHFDQNLLFYEYFHGDNGRGVGSSHQTGWTGLIAKLIQARGREVGAAKRTKKEYEAYVKEEVHTASRKASPAHKHEMRARVMSQRNFDVRDELRATADRRKPVQERAVIGHISTTGGVTGIAHRLAEMFPTIPEDTVQGAVSQLFRTNPNCTRQQLADASLAALLEMSSSTGGPQAVTSFEPVCTSDSQPELPEQEEAAAPVHDEQLDSLLAALLGLPDDELKPCVSTLRSIFSRIAEQPDELKFRRLRKHNPRFLAEVGKHEEALALMLHAGFQQEGDSDSEVLVLAELTESFKQVCEAIRSAAELVAPVSSTSEHLAVVPQPTAFASC